MQRLQMVVVASADGYAVLGQQAVGNASQHVLVPDPATRAVQNEGVTELVALDELGGVSGVRVVEDVSVLQSRLRSKPHRFVITVVTINYSRFEIQDYCIISSEKLKRG